MITTVGQTVKLQSMNAHLIPSKKFKTISIELKLKTKLDRDTITKRAILPYIMRKGSESYPIDTLIQDKLDDLYGASLQIGGHKVGSYHVVTLSLEIANEKFIGDDAFTITDALMFLKDIAFQPNIKNEAFDEQVVNREKDTLIKHYQSIKDDKSSYAGIRFIDEMCVGELYQIHGHGYKEDINAINGRNLYTYYKQMIENDDIDIFVVGDFEPKMMEETINHCMGDIRSVLPTSKHVEKSESVKPQHRNLPKEITEIDTLQQAKMYIGYRTGTMMNNDDFPAMLVFNALFGGYPGSALFVNVREKHGLCYYVGSQIDLFGDKLFVYCGIAPADYEKTCEVIDLELEKMKDGVLAETKLEEAKSLIISQLHGSMDQAAGMIDLAYQQELAGKQRSLESFIMGIRNVTREAVIQCAIKLQKDTIYVLTSKEGE